MAKKMKSSEREGRGYKENNAQYMASTGEYKIRNDYSAHANVPEDVIIEDMTHELGRPALEYEDTPESMQRQMMHDRNGTNRMRPKSRY